MEKSGFFDSYNGDRKYNSQDWADYFDCLINNGVLKSNDSLKVVSNNSFGVIVKRGKAWINGRYYENTEDYFINFSPPDSVTSRIDRVVLRLDFVNREIVLATLTGEPSETTPKPKELTRDKDIYELGLADVMINKGATSITNDDITDIRQYAQLYGIDEVLQSVSNGKKLIAQAITDKGVDAEYTDTFQELADKIRDIQGNDAILAEPSWTVQIGTVTATLDTLNGAFIKFKTDQGSWQTSPVFPNLQGKTRYIFHAMLSNGASTKVVSTSPKANQSAPNAPTILSMTRTTVTVQATSGCKIKYNGQIYSSPYTAENLEAGNSYLFYSVKEATDNLNEAISLPLTHIPPSVFGISVNETDTNPATAVTYIEDSVGVAVANPTSLGGWASKYPFNKIKPCGFKAGKVVKYIKSNDFTKYEDGSSVGSDVDVMIEFPKLYWKFTKTQNGYEVRISESKVDDDFICPAHTIGTKEVDKIYIGAYQGFLDSSDKLRSITGQRPIDDTRIGYTRQYAQANGSGYQQFNYYSMLMLQILYLIAYRNLHSQDALGMGNSSKRTYNLTGTTNTRGMIYGSTDGTESMKFLGIEDLWGNVYTNVDGYYLNTSTYYLYLSKNDKFSNDGAGYESCGQVLNGTTSVSGYLGKVQAGSKTGFTPKEATGSSTTLYCDNCSIGGTYSLLRYGGDAYSYNGVGVFDQERQNSASAMAGGRLVYLGT